MGTDGESLDDRMRVAELQLREAEQQLETAEAALAQARLNHGVAQSDRDAAAARLSSLYALAKDMDLPRRGGDELPLGDLSRTDAIVRLLAQSDRHMSISEVTEALEVNGLSGGYQVVASTLNHLLKEGRIRRPARGRYAAG